LPGMGSSGVGDEAQGRLDRIAKVVLVGSGKGGVGKSLVACGLGLSLSHRGLAAALLDLDVHGASVPEYLGVKPPVTSGEHGLKPKEGHGVRIMSVALFTGTNPLPIRGEEKQDLITQLFASTDWGDLDYLIVDLPPSLGDELLSAIALFAGKSELVVVTTPSPEAVSVVSRLRRIADSERVPVAGIVVNMASLEVGGNTTYPFGRLDRNALEKRLRANVIAELPLEPGINEHDGLARLLSAANDVSRAFDLLCDKI
jgi:ATP-binding protein involved in chromosome partitioning